MRPGQNKRMRGRNRRGPNPLTRSYESNGPDVKIRGTAAHIAEKYVQLARDAHASGDPVAAESYLQHAEHYLRLIAAAQQQQFQAQQAAMGGKIDDAEDFDGDDEFESSVMDRFTFRAPQAPLPPGFQGEGNGEQPRADYPPRQDQPHHQPRENRGPNEFRRDRGPNDFRRDRHFDRNQPRPERVPQVEGDVQGEGALPSFITAPVRIPIEGGDVAGLGEQPEVAAVPGEGEEGLGRFSARPRRRRHRRGGREDGGADAGENVPQEAASE